jgi:hypothetical protein
VEGHLDVLAVEHPDVYLLSQERIASLLSITHLDRQRVERVASLRDSKPKFFTMVAQDLLKVVKSFSDIEESLRSVPDGVESGQIGQKSLGSANI